MEPRPSPGPGTMVAVAQARSSGASVATMALATVWPRPVVVAELDPAGGDIATRFALSANAGVLGLAASGGAVDPDRIAEHLQSADGVAVLVGPPGSDQAEAALGGLWTSLPPVLANLPGGDVLADCGRLGPASPGVRHVVPHAGAVALVTRADREGFVRLHHGLARSPDALVAKAVVVLVGEGRPGCRAGDFERALGVEVAGVLADDWRAAELISAGRLSCRSFRSSALARSARPVAELLAARAAMSTPAPPAHAAANGTWPGQPTAAR